MRKLGHLLATAICAIAFTSCASLQKTAPTMGITSTSLNTYAAADIDYESAKRVEGTVETKTIFGISMIRNGNKTLKSTTRYRGFSKREQQAMFRAKEQGNVDLILEPQFEIEKHSWFFGLVKSSITTVKGWGVKIKGIKEDKLRNI